MHGKREGASHAEDGPKGVGTGTQMSDGTEKLQGMSFFLQGVVRIRGAENLHGPRVYFPALPGCGGFY